MKNKKDNIKEVSKEITLNMRFKDIKVIKFSQFDLESEVNSLKEPLVEFQTNFQFRAIEKEDLLACLISVKLVLLATNEDFAELKVESFFEIKPFNEVIKKVENKYDIPDGILVNIASLSASTVRGILFEKLKGTIVEKEVYPLIDVNSLFNEFRKK
ncbi:hypothetical protein [Flavobacterium sp.]|uniref:hypothetical protein n=1 Tax=Flavobacterium sp. TaxID=239 RepID=UPI0040486477